ncbi:hypothetical protein I79_010055 [Cricetulus griseus]|uniref:Uncharacterized protein n=1 Tax=Cricetulus griseus TaxID=10029 RepID=G3HHF4_CRIGR|nr:hypothetical protein I79_010055 [Cricetulus griseus]
MEEECYSLIKREHITHFTINLSAKSRLSPTAMCELDASCPPELGPNEYTERLVLVTMLLGQ